MHQGGEGVKIPWATVGLARQRLDGSPMQHQEETSGVWAAQEVVTEGAGGAGSLIKVLPRGSSGGAIVWSGGMGDFGANGAEVRGIACGFPTEGHKKKYKASEGRFMVQGDEKKVLQYIYVRSGCVPAPWRTFFSSPCTMNRPSDALYFFL